MKKTLLIILVLALIFSLLNGCSLFSDFEYKNNGDGTCTITRYKGKLDGDLNIPEKINGLTVTTIGDYAFSMLYDFTGELNIPDSVTVIGDYAFSQAGFTGELNIPDSVTVIGDWAFCYCEGLTGNLTIPNSVTYIGESAFNHCRNLTGNLIIPESVITIGDNAFSGCVGFSGNLIIPASVTSIGWTAFEYCNVASIEVSEQNPVYSSVDGILSNKYKSELIFAPKGMKRENYVIPKNITAIGRYAFSGCFNFTGSLSIPDSVINIADDAFKWGSGITSIEVSEQNPVYSSVDGILFNKDKSELIKMPVKMKKENYIIPSSVKIIRDGAFCYCEGLTGNLTIPDSVVEIGEWAFNDCNGLTGNLIIPNSVKTIGMVAFNGCKGFTGSLIIPDSVTNIGFRAFLDCTGLTDKIVLSKNIETIGLLAFQGCIGITSIEVSEQNALYSSLDGILFNKDKSKLLSIPEGIKKENYIIPNSVTKIGDSAFRDCIGLTGSLTIPDSVEIIEDDAITGCKGLSQIEFLGDEPEIGSNFLQFCADDLIIIYDSTKEGWGSYEKKGFWNYPCYPKSN